MAERFTKSQIEAAHLAGRRYWYEQRLKHSRDDTIALIILLVLLFGIPIAILGYQKWHTYHQDQMRYNQIMEGSKVNAN